MKMHPRTSSIAFLEVVNGRGGLQGIMKDWYREGKRRDDVASVAVDMSRMIESAAAPIFGVDSHGLINGWNAKMCELTVVVASEAHGKSLVKNFVHLDSRGIVKTLITKALQAVPMLEEALERKNVRLSKDKPQDEVDSGRHENGHGIDAGLLWPWMSRGNKSFSKSNIDIGGPVNGFDLLTTESPCFM